MSTDTLANLATENRTFAPDPLFAAQANATAALYDRADADRLGFWAEQAERLAWDRRWDEVLDWSDAPFAKWFVGGQLNVSANCLDRHVAEGRGARTAIIFEREDGATEHITYTELLARVSQAAHAITALGVRAGDRVAIYMSMTPEAVVAMLACARIGAVHSVVFGGFAAEALRSRIDDAQAKLVITADGQYRRGSAMALKPAVDEAVEHCPSVEHVLVVRHTGQDVDWLEGRDVWWHEWMPVHPTEHTPQSFDSEHPLFILYTSGTTGKPKGILHTSGGYLTQAASTFTNVFDLKPETDVYWCTADIGWVTGHSYIVYGPLANGATQLIYEGTPDTPHRGRFWEIIEKHRVTILYTAPTAIRTFMKWGDDLPGGLRPVEPAAAGVRGRADQPGGMDVVPGGHRRRSLPDRGHLVADRDRRHHDQPPARRHHLQARLGDAPAARDLREGRRRRGPPGGSRGRRVPRADRAVAGDAARDLGRQRPLRRHVLVTVAGFYFAGDGAKLDEDGAIWLLGRVDDVMNVSGHRISTTEVESALVSHDAVAEAAVVGAADATTGQGIVAFVILRSGVENTPDLVGALRAHVAHEIGPIAKPRQILVVSELPKTRSGKIMRRLLRDLAEHRDLGDVTTLADPTIMAQIQAGLAAPAPAPA